MVDYNNKKKGGFGMDIDRISDIALDITTEWRDVQVLYLGERKEKDVIVPLILSGSNGIYVFIDSKLIEDAKEIYLTLKNIFHLRDSELYLFFGGDDETIENGETLCSGYAYDPEKAEVLEFRDLYKVYEIFYYNHLIPQADLGLYDFRKFRDYFEVKEIERAEEVEEAEEHKYVKPFVSSERLESVELKLAEMLSSGIKKGKYTYYPSGRVTVKKLVGGNTLFSSLSTKVYDYPCLDETGDYTYLTTAFGGWFGLHKFKQGDVKQGILYLLTCGGFCVFHLLDILSLLLKDYKVVKRHYFRNDADKIEKSEERIYARPIENKKLLLTIPLAILLSFGMLKTVYFSVYDCIFDKTTGIIEKVSISYLEKQGNYRDIEEILNEDS